jgi:hypothetical protein
VLIWDPCCCSGAGGAVADIMVRERGVIPAFFLDKSLLVEPGGPGWDRITFLLVPPWRGPLLQLVLKNTTIGSEERGVTACR